MEISSAEGKGKKGAQSRRKVVEAARELFVAFGYSGTSMSDIAKAAGVNKSLIYHHFESKDQLWNEILFSITDHFLQSQRNCFNNPQDYSADFVRDLLRISFTYLSEHPEMVRMYMWANMEDRRLKSNKLESAERWVYVQIMLENIRRAQNAGSLRDDVPPLHIFQFLMGSMSFWFQTKERRERMVLVPAEDNIDENYLNSLIKLFFQGVLPK